MFHPSQCLVSRLTRKFQLARAAGVVLILSLLQRPAVVRGTALALRRHLKSESGKKEICVIAPLLGRKLYRVLFVLVCITDVKFHFSNCIFFTILYML